MFPNDLVNNGQEEVIDYGYASDDDDEDEDLFYLTDISKHGSLRDAQREMRAADRLSVRLLAVEDNEEEENRLLRQSLRLATAFSKQRESSSENERILELDDESEYMSGRPRFKDEEEEARRRVWTMIVWAFVGFLMVAAGIVLVGEVTGPPNQPVGPYSLVESQTGEQFFQFYSFYEGADSVGSNGYNQYVNREHATDRGILNVTVEMDPIFDNEQRSFVYLGSSPTNEGPRDSIRLEGNRRFNRGLFIIDVRHMPAGCGVWPAFWLTDEENWPVHGEIDIVEGVNYQSVAKTALHSTDGCSMYDIPLGTMSGGWDTAQGIPNSKTGIPDMTLRYAQNCFVYDPHQWLNQGCVAVDVEGDSIGQPLNANGGGVYVLEWDPINRHIRSWVFSPHSSVPDNLGESIRTANLPNEERVAPNPELWPLPYGYFAIGEGTECPSSHFRQMRLVFNTAFCGSVAGNRFHLDCPAQAQQFETCNDWIKSDPDEMNEAYWKIGGVLVYEREWEKRFD